MNDYQPGIYEVISDVKIRRTPAIIEGIHTNQVGLLKVGTRRAIYSILTVKDNTTWGRVSLYDSAGISEWVCIKSLNREYMKFIEPLENNPVFVPGSQLDRIENKIDDILKILRA